MKVSRNAVINSNINNFCSPNKFVQAHIHRINPDKSTFLNSNLLVSNIINHLSPFVEPKDKKAADAYARKDEEVEKHLNATLEKKDRISRVKMLAKCRSQTTFDQMQREEEELRKNVDKINEMKMDMDQKARDIMSRKQDTAYLGRNLFLEGEKYIKDMKVTNPVSKTNKVEATRMLMKERAKTKGRAMRRQLNLSDNSEISNAGVSLNTSLNTSTNLDCSFADSHRTANSRQNQLDKDQQIAKMIKNASFSSVLSAQKRQASWQSFTSHWALGFKKNDDLITTKKKRKARKSPKQKYFDVSQSNELEYSDKMSRHQALKKFKQTFDKTAATYQIMSQ